jgi:hypothetical protein
MVRYVGSSCVSGSGIREILLFEREVDDARDDFRGDGRNARVASDGVAYLKGLSQLRILDLGYTGLRDEGLRDCHT